MNYRAGDELASGERHGAPADHALTPDTGSSDKVSPAELPVRPDRGAHSSDRLSTDTGAHRYTYQRPPDAPARTRARHAAPADDEDDPTPPPSGSPRWDPGTTPAESTDRSNGWDGPDDGYRAPDDGYRAPDDGYRTHRSEPGGWDGQPRSAGTLTATRPLRASRRPYRPPLLASDAETELVPLPTAETEVIDPAEAEVPFAPPTAGGRLRFLTGKHMRLRIAAVSVLVVGSAVGIVAGTLSDSTPDKAKISDVQAEVANTAVPTPDANPGQEQTSPAEAELILKERQQVILGAARKLAASKAAAALADAAATAKRAEKARASRNESQGTTGAPVPTVPVDCNTYSGNRATGCALLPEFGFDTGQMGCLDKLWTRESEWTTTAENPSGAYGIPQALPGDKMSSVADDWKTNPATQIRWGLGYIKGRYSNPCGAWAQSEATGSY